jgi:hypothetical protein
VLVLNDHWAKPMWSNWWTGKISDVAGLIFFPLFLQGLWETSQAAVGRTWHAQRHVLVAAALATLTVFTAIQLSETFMDVYRYGLGALQWPFQVAAAWLSGLPMPSVVPVRAMADPTDLIALPGVLIGVAAGWRRSRWSGLPFDAATTPRGPDGTAPH